MDSGIGQWASLVLHAWRMLSHRILNVYIIGSWATWARKHKSGLAGGGGGLNIEFSAGDLPEKAGQFSRGVSLGFGGIDGKNYDGFRLAVLCNCHCLVHRRLHLSDSKCQTNKQYGDSCSL